MKRTIEIETADGISAATIHGDTGGGAPGVILYMDAFGPRPALWAMADRLASNGYVVLVPDLFYRFGSYGPYDARIAFSEEKTRAELMGMLGGTSQDMTRRDTGAFLRVLDEAGAGRRVGAVGYCMGGARALNAAAAYPDRIAAAASFHGGHLASDAHDSPHRHASTIRGRVYVGSAGVDQSFPPEQAARLAEALRAAEVDHAIENYVGMRHGWCMPDHGVFDAAGAERHWKRLLTFFDETLGSGDV